MVATATAIPLSSPLFPCHGIHRGRSPFRSLQWTLTQRLFRRRASLTTITASVDLKPPSYPLNALEPHMSKETLEYHWGKHHRTYVENLNKQIVGTELDGMILEDIILATYNKGVFLPPFNNAAQVWNHEFFWESMKPDGGGKPSEELLELIDRDFGSFEKFINEFKLAASTQFGSGWAWLVYKANRLNVGNAVNPCPSDTDKKLVIVKSPNAVNPLVWDYSVSDLIVVGSFYVVSIIYYTGWCTKYDASMSSHGDSLQPLLTIDVWEHAYYLDFQNRRPDYITTFMEKLVSWEAVSSRLELAKAWATEREMQEEKRKREEEEAELAENEAVEMYVESDTDDSEAE
ncbi:Manganese/iron superoxide dismutase, N-terminal [Dillenia turbinata]|uniref:superoxide dismutase n=1 Tax=Dillenia turbinata TaxID=194707 RepID=A0AAN8Z4I7_9MAGN